jgi:glycosyltransferase involved in cell wall biosynthesis
MIDLSVIIPVYNAAPSINRTLDSIFNQQTSYAIEVILIDDGSKDNSIEIIKTRKEANITLLRQKKRRTFCCP